MKNIPIFTSAGGTATLILREVPPTGRAYVILQTHLRGYEPVQIQECAAFCRTAGAREVYVSCADGAALALPHSHDMLRLQLRRGQLEAPGRSLQLESVQSSDDRALYLKHYNRRFAPIPNAAQADLRSLERAEADGTRHWLLRAADGRLVGLGAVQDNRLEAVASLQPGWGRDLSCTLLAETCGPVLELTVCSSNLPAMRLYQSLGFTQCDVLSRWYRAV